MNTHGEVSIVFVRHTRNRFQDQGDNGPSVAATVIENQEHDALSVHDSAWLAEIFVVNAHHVIETLPQCGYGASTLAVSPSNQSPFSLERRPNGVVCD
jgi:hypothetical protein